jgi:hypothetical protein
MRASLSTNTFRITGVKADSTALVQKLTSKPALAVTLSVHLPRTNLIAQYANQNDGCHLR